MVGNGFRTHLVSPNSLTNFEFKAEIYSESGANGGHVLSDQREQTKWSPGRVRGSGIQFTAGRFGLQANTQGKSVSYRKVMIKPLPSDSLAAWAEARKDVPELSASIR